MQQRESKCTKKADVKAQGSPKLLDDAKGGMDCGVEAGGEGWQRTGSGRDASLLPREMGATRML